MLKNVPVRLGLLGCADVATRRVLPVVPSVPGMTLLAAASRDADKARSVTERFGGEPVTGYDALLERDDVDAVYLPLPSELHAPWIRRALLAGKHVLAEKPLTTSLTETTELVELADEQNLVLQENFMFPQHSAHAQVRRMLNGGEIGELRSFVAAFAIPPRQAGDIRLIPELGGGALFDVGAYPLRAARLLLGDELEVVGAALRHDDRTGVDLSGGILMRTPAGVLGHLEFGLEHHYTSYYQLLGSTGKLTLEHAFTPPAHHRPVVRVEQQDHRSEWTLPADDQCANTLGAFVEAVRGGKRAAPGLVEQAQLVDRAGWLAREERSR